MGFSIRSTEPEQPTELEGPIEPELPISLEYFNSLRPFEQRQYLFDLKEFSGSDLSRLFNPHILTSLLGDWLKTKAVNLENRQKAFEIYLAAKHIFKERYQKMISTRRDFPKINGRATLEQTQDFREKFWENRFTGSEQTEFLCLLANDVDLLSAKTLNANLDKFKQAIDWGPIQAKKAVLFTLNEIVAKYRLSISLENRVRELLAYVFKNYSHPQIKELAKEGLELMGYNISEISLQSAYRRSTVFVRAHYFSIPLLFFIGFLWLIYQNYYEWQFKLFS